MTRSTQPILVIGWAGIDHFHEGENVRTAVGGKAFNQAKTLSNWTPTALLAAIGRDHDGDRVLQTLGRVDNAFIQRRSGLTGQVHLYDNGERITIEPGVVEQITERDILIAVDHLQPGKIMVTAELNAGIMHLVGQIGNEFSIPVVANIAPAVTTRIDATNFALVIVNEAEARALAHLSPQSTPAQVAAKLGRTIERVIVTLGERGCIYSDHQVLGSLGAYVKGHQPVGAGDTFCAVAAFVYHDDMPLSRLVTRCVLPTSLVAASGNSTLTGFHARALTPFVGLTSPAPEIVSASLKL